MELLTEMAPSWQWVREEKYSPLQMEAHGPQGLLVKILLSPMLPMLTVSLWQWVIQGPFLLHPMEPHGPRGLLKQQTLSVELLTEMVPSWQWAREE